ncbi:GNAT family N-acetyltransferase [Kitasatospora sp. NPDC058965]|uniref:GNAT family N-acetyltransferase n=1 Tax=Kitasatospora sp. NPDC058965 TaxID=3346682 RepID=UPI0036A78001
MNTTHPLSHSPERAARVVRVSDTEWQALVGDTVVGRGDAARRPDGRLFISVDAWQGPLFDRIARAVLADLPAPVHTVVDDSDADAAAAWERVGFAPARRERGYRVPCDPQLGGLGDARPPAGVTVLPAGAAQEGPLRALDRVVHREVEAAGGWRTMPAQVLPCPPGTSVVDPSKYAVAQYRDQYVGLLRVGPLTREPRVGLLAVRADWRRRGVGRALLAHSLGALHRRGTTTAWAEVDESNAAAIALFEGIGARRAGGTLELVRH